MSNTTGRCTRVLGGLKRACRGTIEITTDGNGRMVTTCQKCAWHRAGRCWRCGASRGNDRLRGVYCESCKVLARRECEMLRLQDPAIRKKKNAKTSKRWHTDEAFRARKHARNRVWRKANPDRVKKYKRKSALNPTAHRKERERFHNSRPERIASKRAYALAKYYEAHPMRPTPVCRDCGNEFTYTPPGRPRVRCEDCFVPAQSAA